MARAFAIFLGISFALIALFGFSVVSATMSGTHVGCVADVFQELQGSACPVTESPFALLSSHLASLQGFVGNSGAGFLWLFALILLACVALWPELSPPAFSFVRTKGVAAPHSLAKYHRWTALHETSPTDLS